MIPYLGCERAQELLEPFVDGELPVADQVALESHLRWCRTCGARVEDLRLIGASLRLGSPIQRQGTSEQALTSLQASALMRVRAERDQSYGTMFREMFADMRLLWPLLGASAAVLLVFSMVAAILHSTAEERRVALAFSRSAPPAAFSPERYGVIMIETAADPGSDRNPLRLDDAMSLPRVANWLKLESLPEDDAIFALATVVNRNGRIDNYELLRTDRPTRDHEQAEHTSHVDAVLAAVRDSRFAPAQSHGGQAVAVNMVWLIAKTTVQSASSREAVVRPTESESRETPKGPAVEPAVEPGEKRTGRPLVSTTA